MKPNHYSYTYSAKDTEEVKKIREKYAVKEKSDLDRLRALDRRPDQKAMIWALSLGIPLLLLFGGGMALALLQSGALFALGIVLGGLGILGLSCIYPLYARIEKKERERITPEVLRLSDKLLGEDM